MRPRKLVAVAAMLCAATGTYLGACQRPAQTGSQTAPHSDTQPAAGGRMKAYVDPDTGKLTDHPPPGAEPIPGDVQTPPAAVEKPAPGGGVELDLNPKDDEPAADE